MSSKHEINRKMKELGEIYARYHPPLESRFESEVGTYWSRDWGVTSEVGKLRAVLLHKPGDELLTIDEPLERWRYTEKPDLLEMQADFEKLVSAYKREGVEVFLRKPEDNVPPRLVKSIYTRDPSFAVQGGVIIGRMYDGLRRGEELPTMRTYGELGCPILHTIHGSGTMEGGSVVWINSRHVAVGTTYRGNEEGAHQVKEVIRTIDPDIEVRFVEFSHPSGHLDVPLTMINVGLAVVDTGVLPSSFVDYLRNDVQVELVEKPPHTYIEGTVVLEPGKVLFDMGAQEEKEKGMNFLEELGLEVCPLEISTLTYPRNSGTLHCLTMPLVREPEPE
jgi:N-dimethylarginine dimethylaminohydrolase